MGITDFRHTLLKMALRTMSTIELNLQFCRASIFKLFLTHDTDSPKNCVMIYLICIIVGLLLQFKSCSCKPFILQSVHFLL